MHISPYGNRRTDLSCFKIFHVHCSKLFSLKVFKEERLLTLPQFSVHVFDNLAELKNMKING